MATLPEHASLSATQIRAIPEIRRIGTSDLSWALAEGWKDFLEKRGDLIVIGLLYPIICLVAAVVTFNDPLLPLFFPLVAGLSILGPAAASGFYELARRREEGRDSSWWHFLDPLNGRSRLPLALLTAGLAVLMIGWLVAAYAVYDVTFGADAPLRLGDVFGRLFTTEQGWALILLGNLAGLPFAIATLVFALASFPMVVDQPVDAGLAIRTSLAAAQKNPREVFGWGLRVAALLLLGLIPLAIGLAVVLPWLGYATWHLYTRLVVRD
ncbi:DUF2189 domain-containing protein [Sphingomonas ginsenosidivorax]|uniref:DUF2189 domain-containing protein n=1 Tax=Sphingomonas ginsenosidivorax TaxID=862135 RepID=A0A5C6UG08_9SPHN|nr:DUF2189 domain-containing protein [Sphingomonas ginsenosidivorax]TXC71191.1 DUF2189 domain-containing protein [Sphingomonas ginsenosidivorax]